MSSTGKAASGGKSAGHTAEAQQPRALFVLVGDDAFMRRQRTHQLCAEWLAAPPGAKGHEQAAGAKHAAHAPGPAWASDAVLRFDLAEDILASVLEAAASLPMFVQRQVIIAHNLNEVPAAEHKGLLAFVARLPSSNRLILLSNKLDARTQLSKQLLARGLLEKLAAPGKQERHRWLVQRAEERGASLTFSAAALLVGRVGDDMALLDEALNRVDLYVGQSRAIEREDVLAITPQTREASIFALTDAVSTGPWSKASACLNALLQGGEQPLVVLAMLLRQVRLLLSAQQGPPQGVPPFVADSLMRRAKHLPRAALRASLKELQRCDEALKFSKLPPVVILERAIWPLSSAAQAAPVRR